MLQTSLQTRKHSWVIASRSERLAAALEGQWEAEMSDKIKALMFYQDIKHHLLCLCSTTEVHRNSPFPPRLQTSAQRMDPSTEKDRWLLCSTSNKHLPCFILHVDGWGHPRSSHAPPSATKNVNTTLSWLTLAPPRIKGQVTAKSQFWLAQILRGEGTLLVSCVIQWSHVTPLGW